MQKIKEVAVIVQARLSSQRCKRKMVRDFAGTTLMNIILDKLEKSSIPNKNIVLSVYEEELLQICQEYPFNIYKRSERSAFSEGTPLTEMYEWWDKIDFDSAVLINACCPFLKTETIERFYNSYSNSLSNGMFGVIEKKNYYWDKDDNFLTPLKEDVMNTKTADPIKEAAHCLYAGILENIGKGIWMGDFSKKGDIELFTRDEEECLDIDYEWQFQMCEALYKNKNDKL